MTVTATFWCSCNPCDGLLDLRAEMHMDILGQRHKSPMAQSKGHAGV